MTTTETPDLPPQPVPDPDSQGYWEATAAGTLAICRCSECGTWMHPPLERCRKCGGPTSFEPVGRTGTIHSFIVMHRSSVPGQVRGPHVLAAIDLDGAPGVRLTGRVVGIEPARAKVGMRVEARIVDVPGGPFKQPEFVVLGDGGERG